MESRNIDSILEMQLYQVLFAYNLQIVTCVRRLIRFLLKLFTIHIYTSLRGGASDVFGCCSCRSTFIAVEYQFYFYAILKRSPSVEHTFHSGMKVTLFYVRVMNCG